MLILMPIAGPMLAAGQIPLIFAAQTSDNSIWFFILGGAALVAVWVWFGVKLSKKRSRELQTASLSMGYTFEGAGKILAAEIGTIPVHLFSLGRTKIIDNVLRGPGGAVVFDYQYITGGGRYQSTTRQTVAGFRFSGAAIPQFQLGPEHWWHKVGDVVSHQLIRFDSHPAFSKRFLLRGPDAPSIRMFFTPPLLTYLESLPEKPAWTIEADGPWLLVYVHSHRIRPAALQSFANEASTIAAQIAANAGTRLTAG